VESNPIDSLAKALIINPSKQILFNITICNKSTHLIVGILAKIEKIGNLNY
jgi:hypothetical protein